ncbi:unnamed protein product [Peniophora sp. CBMAI 1063]|nr:unnamed protein product [Peniophora sp. CBMAI 1063]
MKESATEAEDWMDQLEALFRIKNITSNTVRIETALSYFVKDAAPFARQIRSQCLRYKEWWRQYAQAYQNNIDHVPEPPVACNTWNEFRAKFMHDYVDVDPVETARDKIAVLRMHKNQRADDFLVEFRNLAERTGYDGAALVRMLQQSLIEVPVLLEKVLSLRKRPNGAREQGAYCPETLEEWYATVGDYDRAYRQAHARTLEAKKQNTPSSSASRPNNQQCTPNYRPPPGPPPNYRPPPGPPPPPRGPAGSFALRPRHPNYWAPQGQVNTSPPQSRPRYDRRDGTGTTYGGRRQPMNVDLNRTDMSQVECYNCGRKGHMSRECCSPRRARAGPSQPAQVRQVDALLAQQLFSGKSEDSLSIFSQALQQAQSTSSAKPAQGF